MQTGKVMIAVGFCILALHLLLAEVPATMNYQGRLVEDGELVNQGGMSLTLTLYDSPTAPAGGTNSYFEIDTVDVVDGLYSTTFGDNAVGGSYNSLLNALNALGTNAWLGIKFGTDPELTPRQRLLSSPFAINVRGIYVSESEKVGIGTDAPDGMFHAVAGPTYQDTPIMERTGTADDITPTALRLRGKREGDMGEGFGVGLQFQIEDDTELVNSAGVIGAMRESTSDDDTAMFFRTRGTAGGTVEHMRITSEGKVGIGTNTPAEALHVAGAAVLGKSESSTPVAGTIRWNGSEFEGYNGAEWVSLAAGVPISPPSGMSYIPPRSFQMGDNYSEGAGDEEPVHTVYVSGFYMDKFEVTNEEMREVMQWAYDQGLIGAIAANTVTNNGVNAQELLDLDDSDCQISFSGGTFTVDSGKTNFPCIEVSWYGAQAYCNYKSDMEGLQRCTDFDDWTCDFGKNGYRLPTEAEWEKAGRGGLTGHHYPWDSSGGAYGDHIDGSKANYDGSGDPYDNGTSPVGYYDGDQTPAGSDMANGYGLYDMAGNVWEWCADWYPSGWYDQPGATQNDTSGPAGPLSYRVLRGGSWGGSTGYLRCAVRVVDVPSLTNNGGGFRCARGL